MLENARILGVQKNLSGEYQGHRWSHHKLHVLWLSEMPYNENTYGRKVEVLKVPNYPDLNDVVNRIKIGDVVEIDFDRSNRPRYINVIPDPEDDNAK